MKKIIGIIALSAIMLTSCQTLMQTSRNIETGSAITSITLADLNVSDKRESHTISHVTDAMQKGGEENVKRIAEAKILEAANADILVEPRYHVVKKHKLFGGSKITSITVSGRPANFTNFRAIEDSILFRPEKVYVNEKSHSNAYKRNSFVKNSISTNKNNSILDKKKYISLGIGAMTASSSAINYSDPMFAYDISYVKWRPISKSKRWQYGFEIGLSSQGCDASCDKRFYSSEIGNMNFGYLDYEGNYNYSYSGGYYDGYYYPSSYDVYHCFEYVHNIYVVPFQFAYIHEIGRNSAIGLHVGPSVSLSYANSNGSWFDYGTGNFFDLLNVGVKAGWQYRYKKFMIDLCVQTGHLPQWRYEFEHGSTRTSVTFNFCYSL